MREEVYDVGDDAAVVAGRGSSALAALATSEPTYALAGSWLRRRAGCGPALVLVLRVMVLDEHLVTEGGWGEGPAAATPVEPLIRHSRIAEVDQVLEHPVIAMARGSAPRGVLAGRVLQAHGLSPIRASVVIGDPRPMDTMCRR